MSWQFIIILQIVVSSLVTLFMRQVALSKRRVFFAVSVFSYLSVAIVGSALSILHNHGMLGLPTAREWTYIFVEGICIPVAWLFQYKLIGYIGAGNAVIVGAINTVGGALMGVIFLSEPLSVAFISGAFFVMGSVFIALRIQPDMTHHSAVPLYTKILIAFGSFLFYSVGIFYEKRAIDAMGVWNYSSFGWGMQFIGAISVFALFGRNELAHIDKKVVRSGLLLGLITSLSGALYILAVSKGTLSHTIVATSGKVAVTMLLSAIILKERNQLNLRLTAFLLSSIGIGLILF